MADHAYEVHAALGSPYSPKMRAVMRCRRLAASSHSAPAIRRRAG